MNDDQRPSWPHTSFAVAKGGVGLILGTESGGGAAFTGGAGVLGGGVGGVAVLGVGT